MLAMMERVVAGGTGKRAGVKGIPVAGKTGTSQKFDREIGAYSSSRYWSSFIGLIPAGDPILLCAIVVDEPSAGQNGGEAAAPAFQRIVTQIISNPELDYSERILTKSRGHGDGLPPPARPVAARTPVDRPAQAQPGLREAADGLVYVPEVRNRDVLDAVQEVSARGLVPFVRGSGVVKQQSLGAGTIVRKADVCTLFCAIDG
jgi:membrane peptidoglycan carboxypeptidase